MSERDTHAAIPRTKAALIDAGTMAVLWTNEPPGGAVGGRTVDDVVPMAETLGVAAAAREVASDGVPRYLQADLVSTGKGTMAMVVSLHRLPDGTVLALTENAWVAEGGTRRPRGR